MKFKLNTGTQGNLYKEQMLSAILHTLFRSGSETDCAEYMYQHNDGENV